METSNSWAAIIVPNPVTTTTAGRNLCAMQVPSVDDRPHKGLIPRTNHWPNEMREHDSLELMRFLVTIISFQITDYKIGDSIIYWGRAVRGGEGWCGAHLSSHCTASKYSSQFPRLFLRFRSKEDEVFQQQFLSQSKLLVTGVYIM